MPRLELPSDAVRIEKYNDHDLAGLYYSPSQKALYTHFDRVRKLNINGKKGFYTGKLKDGNYDRTLFISLNKLIKEYAELLAELEWTRPERAPRASKPKAAKPKAESSKKKETKKKEAKEDSDSASVSLNYDELHKDDTDDVSDEPEKPERPKKPKHGIDYASAFRAMRNATRK